MRRKWAWRLTGLAVVAGTAGVALSRGPQNKVGGPALPSLPRATGPELPPAPVRPVAPAEFSIPVMPPPAKTLPGDGQAQTLEVTGSSGVPAFDRALKAEARFQFAEQAGKLFSELPPGHAGSQLGIDAPPGRADAEFAAYLRDGLRVTVFQTLLRDRVEGASSWLLQGPPVYLYAPAARKTELDAALRDQLGAGEALTLEQMLTRGSPPGADSTAQAASFVAFLAQRRASSGESAFAGDKPSAFLKKLAATDAKARQHGATAAAFEWNFQDANEMQSAWLAWLKRPESRPGWAPPTPELISPVMAAAPAPPTYIPATDVGGKPRHPAADALPPPAARIPATPPAQIPPAK